MRLVKLGRSVLLEIFTQSQKLPLALQLPPIGQLYYKQSIQVIQFEVQENQREAFKLPVSWLMVAHEHGDQSCDIRSTRCRRTITESPRHLDLDGLMSSCFKNEPNDALKVLSFGFIFSIFSLVPDAVHTCFTWNCHGGTTSFS